MERQKVESSNLAEIGYDEETQILEIQFKKGAVYQYEGVPVEVYGEFLEAESIGKAFSQLIKGGGYKYTCIGK